MVAIKSEGTWNLGSGGSSRNQEAGRDNGPIISSCEFSSTSYGSRRGVC